MAIRRVRIYKGTTAGSNIIGFSMSTLDAPDDDRFSKFMEERDYTWSESTGRPEDGVSLRYIEVWPPLRSDHLQEFGKLCVGELIDPYHDGVAVYDNRYMHPAQPYGGGILIAEC